MNTEANILIVDDEMGIREGCKRALSEEGYAVDAAEDGKTGLQKVKEKNYDLILVDLMMPGIGGMELIKKVHHCDPEIITVVITGNATIETAVEATKLGAYDYLPKPFSPEALSVVVKRGLEKRMLRLEAKKLYAERTQKMLELVNERSRLRTIIGCMADGVLVANLEGRLVLWNASSVKMLKSKGFDIAGEPLEYYISNEPLIVAIKEILNSDDQDFSMISHEIPAQDEKVILMANIAPVRDEDGKILGAVTVLRDITALKEINKIKSQFVSMVAHELRAPMAAIKGWLEVVVSGEAGGDAEQNKQWLQRAMDRSDSLLALVDDLLVINRMETGKVAQKMGPVKINDIILKIVDLLGPDAEKHKVSIAAELAEDLPSIQADVRDMEKLFTNLISNAIKYNRKNGSVFLEGKVEGNFVCYRIKDTGIGISAEHLSCIFDDFYRADDERTKKIPGTGLGLTIASKIVNSHFGRIEVTSEPDKGSIFSVFLPLEHRKD
ncbi:MAG: response regulator [Candidatus Aminicenantes bacterium]|nr:MAG: response regulator [Candidatus Aminicenantes bacterium]